MTIDKSSGVTETERVLAEFCERSFLKLWSYPNPYKDDGHELCDLLAVFGNNVFIFFDREKYYPENSEKDPQTLWDRWKRKVVDRQIKTSHGAERYIRDGRPIFVDAKKTTPFPISFNPKNAIVHKIIVAHGAKDACKLASDKNIYGSLAITYCDTKIAPTPPFVIRVDKHNPVHIFDSHNLSIILGELDTVTDFSRYLDEKIRAIKKFDSLIYCGEEDLLEHYLTNFDGGLKENVIGTRLDNVNSIYIPEGNWSSFVASDIYKNTKAVDSISYEWDELIQRTCQNALNGVVGGNGDIQNGQSAIYEMVKEPRFMRRVLVDKVVQAAKGFADDPQQLARQVTLMPSYFPNVSYVFFQLWVPQSDREDLDYREKRRTLLEIACGAAKNKFPELTKIIGIGMDAPKLAGDSIGEDFILLPCETWTKTMKSHYEELNRDWNFFMTPQLEQYNEHVTQYVPPNVSK